MTTPMLPFPDGCREGRLVRREKRFSVLVDFGHGETAWAHTNNSGSMLGMLRPGNPVLVSPAANPDRKLKWTLELIRDKGVWAGVNTLTPNRLLAAAHKAGQLVETQGYEHFKAEAKVGDSRLDALLEGPRGQLYVEAKNVTLVEDDTAFFPDAVTVRGQKHLRELMRLSAAGVRVAGFYLAQRADARCFAPADFIDPEFARLLGQAMDVGVEVWPYRAEVGSEGIGLGPRLPLAHW